MIDEAPAPFAAQRRIVAARDQARVLDRDHRLVVVAIERPGLHLALGALAAVQQAVERMQAVIAPRADVAQRALRARPASEQVHSTISMPSSATSQPAASTLRRSGEPSIRIGLVLLMWMKMRRAVEPGERRERAVLRRRSACGPCGGRSCSPVPVRDHLVVGKERAVEQDDVGAREALAQRRRHRRAPGTKTSRAPSPLRSRRRHWRRSRRRVVGLLAFEIERHLAGHREQLASMPPGSTNARPG